MQIDCGFFFQCVSPFMEGFIDQYGLFLSHKNNFAFVDQHSELVFTI